MVKLLKSGKAVAEALDSISFKSRMLSFDNFIAKFRNLNPDLRTIDSTSPDFNNLDLTTPARDLGVDMSKVKTMEILDGPNIKSVDEAPGDVIFKMEDGTTVNIKKVKRMVDDGYYKKAFTELDPDMMKNSTVKNMVDGLENSYSKTKKGQLRDARLEIETTKLNKFRNADGTPMSEADIQKLDTPEAQQYKKMQAEFEGLKKEMNDMTPEQKAKMEQGNIPDDVMRKSDSMFGKKAKLVLGLATLAFLVYIAKDFSDFLKKVADAMSGCWIEHGTSDKCKIDGLTCDMDAIEFTYGDKKSLIPFFEQDGFRMCTVNLGYNGNVGSGSGDWIPLLKDACKCDSTQSVYVGTDYTPDVGTSITSTNPLPKQAYNACSSTTTCTVQSLPAPYTTLQPKCSQTSGCVAWGQGCMNTIEGGRCSKWCDKANPGIMLGLTDTLSCVDADWRDAFIATSPIPFGEAAGFMKDLLKYLQYIVVVVFAIFAFFFLYKLASGGGSSEEPPSYTIPYTTPCSIPTTKVYTTPVFPTPTPVPTVPIPSANICATEINKKSF